MIRASLSGIAFLPSPAEAGVSCGDFDELQRYILTAADFEDSGDAGSLPFEAFEALDELWEIAYLCRALCAL